MYHLAESSPPIEAIAPQAGGSGLEGEFINLRNAGLANIIVHINQGNATQPAITVEQATDVSGTDAKAITESVPIWTNQDCATSDLLNRESDAVSFTPSSSIGSKIIVIQVNPRILDINNEFNCLRVRIAASNAANIVSAQYILSNRRGNESAVVD